MTKQVLLSIVGSQTAEGESDSIELVTVANYYKRNGHHYILYEEIPEENQVVKNTLKFDADFFEMNKKGAVNSQMLFRPDQDTVTYYNTPAGPMTVGVTTTEYTLVEEETYIEVHIRYTLEINYCYSSENEILLRVAPQ